MIIIKLSPDEEALAVRAGKARQARRKAAGVEKDRYSLCDDVELGHVQGVLGELVVSKLLGIPWEETLYEKGECDFAKYGIEVKLRTRHWYEMFLWPKNDSARLYFLVTKEDGTDYQVHGCIWGADAKKAEFWKVVKAGNPPAYFVPRDRLVPAEECLQMLKQQSSVGGA